MDQNITFVPGRHAGEYNQDLIYTERVSKNRSVHILMQDRSSHIIASRLQFLVKSYREIVRRYLRVGRIEHPFAMLREIMAFMENLSSRIDCRVDDFRGLGVYVLVQDANTFYLLTGRDGRVLIETPHGLKSITAADAPGVRELPVDSSSSQKELFSQSAKDFLAIYRIEGRVDTAHSLSILLGGVGEDFETVQSVLRDPVHRGDDRAIPVDLLSCSVRLLRFARVEPNRVAAPLIKKRERGLPPRRTVAAVSTMVAVLIAISAGTMWITNSTREDESGSVASISTSEREAVVHSEASERTRLAEGDGAKARDLPTPEMAKADESGRPTVRLSSLWQREHGAAVTTSPVVERGIVYYGGRDKNLYAVGAEDGVEKWHFSAAGGIGASPVLTGESVVVADYVGRVYCLNRLTGEKKWEKSLPTRVVSTPASDGTLVLVGCMDGSAHCLSVETGRTLWVYKTGGRIRASIGIGRDLFLVPSYDGYLYGLARGSGSLKWRHREGANVASSPDADDRRVVVGSLDGRMVALDIDDGSVLWSCPTGAVKSAVRIAGDGVYFGSDDDIVRCLDVETGAVKWQFKAGGNVLSRPLVADGVVFLTCYDRQVYCLDALTGEKLDSYGVEAPVFSSPAVEAGRLFFGDNGGGFNCLKYLEKRTS